MLRIAFSSVFALFVACATPTPDLPFSPEALPPVAKKLASSTKLHGHLLSDDYAWLRDPQWTPDRPTVEDPEVLQYLNDENAYYHQLMDPFSAGEEKIFNELKSRMRLIDSEVPVRRDGYVYYPRAEEASNFPIYCRKKIGHEAKEEVYLDVNVLAANKPFFLLGGLAVSPDHSKIVYSFDLLGDESYSIAVKDLVTGKQLPDSITGASDALVWHENNNGFFYLQRNAMGRPYRVYYHELGSEVRRDRLVYQVKNDEHYLSIGGSASRRFLFIKSRTSSENEVRALDMKKPSFVPFVIAKLRKGHRYYVDHMKNHFYIRSNDQGKNFRLARAPVEHPDEVHWKTLIAHSEQAYLSSFFLYEDRLVVGSKSDGLPRVQFYSLDGKQIKQLSFPDPSYVADIVYTNKDDAQTRVMYSSLNRTRTLYAATLAKDGLDVLKVYDIPGGYDADLYASERIYAHANDGTRIPISLVYRKDRMHRDGSNPLFVTAYGAYGYESSPAFNRHRFSLLDRGFVFAIAHARGGDELGYGWYEAGKLLNKKNTFTDTIRCVEHLIQQRYSSKGNVVLFGRSAGGLITGYALNERPDLFKGVVAAVPFVDLMNTMLDETLPLTAVEFSEWGNPKEKEFFNYMLSYSPYDNVRPQNYPHLFVLSGLNDQRVTYWEAAKWVAKLRANNASKNLLLLKTNMESGHAASGRFHDLRETAQIYNFVFRIFDVVP